MAIVDVTRPDAPALVAQQPLALNANRVAAAADVAYVGLAARTVAVVDARNGAELEQLRFDELVNDVALAGDRLYVLGRSTLHVFDDFGHGLELLGELDIAAAQATSESRSLFVGGGLAYVGLPAGAQPGYRVVDVSDPSAMEIVGEPSTQTAGVQDLASNGSGLVLATTIFSGGGPRPVSVYDDSDHTVTTDILVSFPLPGSASAVSIFGGLSYVAAGTAGLQVINHRAYDALGVAPGVTLDAPTTVEEGKTVRLTADVTDDVQVREVEFLVDGEPAAVDGGFPFEHRFRLPVGDAPPAVAVRARAIDTGGNSTLSAQKTITVVGDATPPDVRRISPSDRSLAPGSRVTVSAVFDEPLAPGSVTRERLRVFAPGGAEIPGGTLAYRESSNAVLLALPDPLTQVGTYRVVAGPGFADRSGTRWRGPRRAASGSRWPTSAPGSSADFAGAIQAADDEDVHGIAVEAGQRLFFDATQVDGGCGFVDMEWRLTDPDGAVVFDRGLSQCSDHGPVTLAETGTYLLTIRASGPNVGNYAVSVWDVPAPDATAVAIGDTLTGAIESPGREDRWTFAGTSGQRVFVDGRAVDGGCPFTALEYELLRPTAPSRPSAACRSARTAARSRSTRPARGPCGSPRLPATTRRRHTRSRCWTSRRRSERGRDRRHARTARSRRPGARIAGRSPAPTGSACSSTGRDVDGGCPFTALEYELLRPNGTVATERGMSQCSNRGPVTLDARRHVDAADRRATGQRPDGHLHARAAGRPGGGRERGRDRRQR